jgi:hypothetical protein
MNTEACPPTAGQDTGYRKKGIRESADRGVGIRLSGEQGERQTMDASQNTLDEMPRYPLTGRDTGFKRGISGKKLW